MTDSKHFGLERLAEGVYAAVSKAGGGAYSNAGIIDLGDSTLLVDAFDTLAAGGDLRRAAEGLFQRPVQTMVLTHPHGDHWIGASALAASTTLLAHEAVRPVTLEWGAEMVRDYESRAEWEEYLQELEEQLSDEQDARVRAGLEKSIIRTHYTLAEMEQYQPRYADQTFRTSVTFWGSQRTVELRSLGRGHSQDDAVLLLPQEGVAFIGDVGFFATQPFMGFCDLDLYRQQLRFFQDASFEVLVPGHGPVGGKDEVALQLQYFDVLEELVGQVVQRDGTVEEALQIDLPAPFDGWLMGGMGRFEVNVRYMFERLGGQT